jgi:hypothetical protein
MMTEHDDDPFERALEREHRIRAESEQSAWALRSSHNGVLQVLAMLVIPLPLHLWLVGWDKTPWVVVHVVAITVWTVITAITWLQQRQGLPPT